MRSALVTAISLFAILPAVAGAGIVDIASGTFGAAEPLGRMTVAKGEGVSWDIELLAPRGCESILGHSSRSCERVAIWMHSRESDGPSFIWHPASGVLSFSSAATRLGVLRINVHTGRWQADGITNAFSSRFETEISSTVEMIRRELVFRPGDLLSAAVRDRGPEIFYQEGEDDLFCYFFPAWCPSGGGGLPCNGHYMRLVTKACSGFCTYKFAQTDPSTNYENGYTDGSEACEGVCINDLLCYNPY